MIKVVVISYVLISFLIALSYVRGEIKFENELSSVPIGDLEFYKKKESISSFLLKCFPISILLVFLYVGLVKLIKND